MATAARIATCVILLGCGGGESGAGGSGGSSSGGGGTTHAATTAGDAGSSGSGLGGVGNVAGDAAAGGGAAGHGGGSAAAEAGSGVGGATGTAGKTGEGGNAGRASEGGAAGASGGKAGEGGAGSASHPGDAVELQGHFYRFTQASISGASAEAICEGLGGYLACIETENENAFLLTLAGTARPWFGLNNLANQKVWVWINGSPTSYEHWQPGQADNPANEHWGKMKTAEARAFVERQ